MRETHCDYEYLAAGGALYSLEPDEDAALSEHLPHCSRCREMLASSREAASCLSSGIPQVDPPPELRARILDLVEQTPQITARERASGPRSAEVLEGQKAPAVSLDAARQRRSRSRGRMLVAAAAVVFLGVTGVLGARVLQLSQERNTQVAESNRVSQLLDSVSDPTATTTVLNSGDRRAATLITSKRGAVLMPASLRPNDRSHIYVMWATDGSRPTALSTFDVAGTNGRPLALHWSPAASGHATYAVSLEPGRTAPDSPSKVLANGSAVT